MSNTRNSSCTTTGMQVHDTRNNRIATQADAEASAAAQGKKFVANPELSPLGEAFQPAPIVVKQVDHLTLAGSNRGDHRAGVAPAVMPNQPNPRENVGQFPLSARTPAAPAPITTVDSENVGG